MQHNMLNMQSANAGSIPGVGGGMPAPMVAADVGGKEITNSKTNSETVAIVDTNHEGIINDTQFDFFGTRIASCDSQGNVRITKMQGDVVDEQSVAFLVDMDTNINTAHLGPCWQVAWSHPKFESLVATCGYDRLVKVWKEVAKSQWRCVYRHQAEASVNCVQFGPAEYGLSLAAGSADGKILIFDYQAHFGSWAEPQKLTAHNSGVTSLCWGPPQEPCLLIAEAIDQQKNQKGSIALRPKRLVSGGMDRSVKIWKENPQTQKFDHVELNMGGQTKQAHEDWVRDVAWSNNIGLMSDMIATVGEDQKVRVWKTEPMSQKQLQQQQQVWKLTWEHPFNEPVWRCSWSPVGFMLAVCSGENQTVVFQQSAANDEEWVPISEINEQGQMVEASPETMQKSDNQQQHDQL